jgi:hypothetical protein
MRSAYELRRCPARAGSQNDKKQTPAKLRRHEGDGDGTGARAPLRVP